jgi:hypothetical protein
MPLASFVKQAAHAQGVSSRALLVLGMPLPFVPVPPLRLLPPTLLVEAVVEVALSWPAVLMVSSAATCAVPALGVCVVAGLGVAAGVLWRMGSTARKPSGCMLSCWTVHMALGVCTRR